MIKNFNGWINESTDSILQGIIDKINSNQYGPTIETAEENMDQRLSELDEESDKHEIDGIKKGYNIISKKLKAPLGKILTFFSMDFNDEASDLLKNVFGKLLNEYDRPNTEFIVEEDIFTADISTPGSNQINYGVYKDGCKNFPYCDWDGANWDGAGIYFTVDAFSSYFKDVSKFDNLKKLPGDEIDFLHSQGFVKLADFERLRGKVGTHRFGV